MFSLTHLLLASSLCWNVNLTVTSIFVLLAVSSQPPEQCLAPRRQSSVPVIGHGGDHSVLREPQGAGNFHWWKREDVFFSSGWTLPRRWAHQRSGSVGTIQPETGGLGFRAFPGSFFYVVFLLLCLFPCTWGWRGQRLCQTAQGKQGSRKGQGTGVVAPAPSRSNCVPVRTCLGFSVTVDEMSLLL